MTSASTSTSVSDGEFTSILHREMAKMPTAAAGV
jgi:hypothetical protein